MLETVWTFLRLWTPLHKIWPWKLFLFPTNVLFLNTSGASNKKVMQEKLFGFKHSTFIRSWFLPVSLGSMLIIASTHTALKGLTTKIRKRFHWACRHNYQADSNVCGKRSSAIECCEWQQCYPLFAGHLFGYNKDVGIAKMGFHFSSSK